MTPTEFRENARGLKITYGIAESPLGKMLVASTGVGRLRGHLWQSGERARRRSAGPLCPGGDHPRRRRVGRDSAPGARADERASAGGGAASRCAGDGLPAPGVDGATGDSARRDAQLCPGRSRDRSANRGAGGRSCLRFESGCGGDSLPPRGRERREADRLPLGRRAEAEAA